IEVDPYDYLQIGRGKGRDVHEHVHRTFGKLFAWLDVRGLLPRDVHRDEWIEVEVGIDADGVRLLLGDRRRTTLRHHSRRQRGGNQQAQCQRNRALVHVAPPLTRGHAQKLVTARIFSVLGGVLPRGRMSRMMCDRSHNCVTPSNSVRPAIYCNTAQVYAATIRHALRSMSLMAKCEELALSICRPVYPR